MKTYFKRFLGMLLLAVCGIISVTAQTTVGIGAQITSEENLVSGTAYIIQSTLTGTPYVEDATSYYSVPSSQNLATTATCYYMISNGDGTWKIKNQYTEKYWGKPVAANTEPATSGFVPSDESSAGDWTLNFNSGTFSPTCNGFYVNRASQKLHAWDSGSSFKIFTVEELNPITPTASEIYTLNNTNSNRGALTYDETNSTKWVWSSGKSGATTFDATSTNCQWIIYPTGTDDQYYLYNVGAQKFAVPVTGGTYSGYSWAFSDNAVAVSLIIQSDGTYKIKTVTGDVYAAVSNNYIGPIINYNDKGAQFTITKQAYVTDDITTQLNAAVNKLIHKTTPLSAAPTSDGWYAVRINTASQTSFVDNFVYTLATEVSGYPLAHANAVKLRPAISDATYFLRITPNGSNYDWQMPNGKYLIMPSSHKFPVSSTTKNTIGISLNNNAFRFTAGQYYADAYDNYIGETQTANRTLYDIYPIDLTSAGLTAWQVTINAGTAGTTKATCNRADVSGLTTVYTGGFFFLPTGVTPEDTDFSISEELDGDFMVDADAKIIYYNIEPEESFTVENMAVIQGNQTTGLGNDMQALLRVKVTTAGSCNLTKLNASLTDGIDQLDNIAIYYTTNDELNAAGASPVKISENITPAASMEIPLSTSKIYSGTTFYLWVTGDVKSDATEWETIDATVTSLSYSNVHSNNKVVDISSIGDPDGEMRIYKQQAFLWTPSHINTQYYRIPTILRTADGGIIAFTDDRLTSTPDLGNHKIDVVMKKSTDNGVTWGDELTIAAGDGTSDAAYGYGDAAVVRTASGKLICIMAAGKNSFPSGMKHVGVSYSSDNGATWTEPVDIYSSIDFGGVTPTSVFTTAGKGVTFSNGRVAFAMNVKVDGTIYEYALYSDNADEETPTWKISTSSAYTGADESKFEIMNDNSLLVSVRRGSFNGRADRGYNRTTGDASGDGINTWGDTGSTWSDMNANGCNADILYYNRSTEDTTRPDVILHTLTKQFSTYRKDLRLYVSFDQGATWKEAFQLQPGYAAYSSMQKLANGDLAIIFEDGSIGNVDKQDCYAINYVVISSETLNAKIDELYEEDFFPVVKNSILNSTTGPDTYGSYSNASGVWYTTWTSNGVSGKAGVTIVAPGYDLGFGSAYDQRAFLLRPSAGGATDEITITAPNGYIIDSYTMSARNYSSSQSYKLIAPNQTEYPTNVNNVTTMTVENVNAQTSTFKFYGSSTSNFLCILNCTITLRPNVKLNAVGTASYATLYLPFDVTMNDGTKAYYVGQVTDGYAKLTEAEYGIPAKTAVVLINSSAATSTTYTKTTGLSPVISEEANLLKGTLSSMTLDLSDETPYFSLGVLESKIGFYKFQNGVTTSITLGANKAYLEYEAGAGVKGFKLDFGGTDGIQSVATPAQTGDIYDLSGRRVSQPTRGLYIVNGKKVIIK